MIRTSVFSAVALLLAGAAWAAGPGLASADSDGDGNLSLAEFENAALERARDRFAQLDADGDGMLAGDELRRSGKDRSRPSRQERRDPQQVFERLDTDGSGGVSFAELGASRAAPDEAGFAAADADANSELDAAEFEALLRARFADRRGHRSK